VPILIPEGMLSFDRRWQNSSHAEIVSPPVRTTFSSRMGQVRYVNRASYSYFKSAVAVCSSEVFVMINFMLSCCHGQCVRMVMNLALAGPNDGIMVPIPQYPLYSASIALYGGQLVGYYLDEDNTWALDVAALEESLAQARSQGITVKAMVFINPVS
jgi:bifunctional pyridoxal-dependent enzyme with beta-cystathionase and maltose regulon repressor activities